MCRTYFFFFFFFFENVFIQAHCWLLIWLTDWLTYSVDSHKYLLTYLPFVLGLIDSRQDRTNRLCAAGVAGSCQVLITASCRSFFSQMKTYGYNFFAPGLTDLLTYLLTYLSLYKQASVVVTQDVQAVYMMTHQFDPWRPYILRSRFEIGSAGPGCL